MTCEMHLIIMYDIRISCRICMIIFVLTIACAVCVKHLLNELNETGGDQGIIIYNVYRFGAVQKCYFVRWCLPTPYTFPRSFCLS